MLPTEKTVPKNDFLRTKVCIAGAPKTGKSTFASQLGDTVLFLATERGHDFLSVFKVDINEWNDFEKAISELKTAKHSFTTVVIDVVDNLIEMCEAEICKRNKVQFLKDIPFGGGWTASKSLLKSKMIEIQNMNLGITLVTHTKDKEVKQEVVTWTAVGTSIPKSYEESLLGLCDLILYAYVNQANQRVIRTKPTKFIQCAGDRSNKLPEVMPLDAKLVIDTLKGTHLNGAAKTEVKTELKPVVTKQVQLTQ